MVCLLRQHARIPSEATCNFSIAPIVQRQCSFYSYGEAWYGHNKTDHQPCQAGQTPVLTVNQPVYALAKKIQWAWHDVYGQRQFVEMMGGLHIEMAMLNVLSDFLDGSGWVSVMTYANVTTEGMFDMHIESLREIIPLMFALDHYHYARWMSFHVKDLLALNVTCPAENDEFVKGNFVTQKSQHKCSALAHDQVHE